MRKRKFRVGGGPPAAPPPAAPPPPPPPAPARTVKDDKSAVKPLEKKTGGKSSLVVPRTGTSQGTGLSGGGGAGLQI